MISTGETMADNLNRFEGNRRGEVFIGRRVTRKTVDVAWWLDESRDLEARDRRTSATHCQSC